MVLHPQVQQYPTALMSSMEGVSLNAVLVPTGIACVALGPKPDVPDNWRTCTCLNDGYKP
jgi:hypothetical protein